MLQESNEAALHEDPSSSSAVESPISPYPTSAVPTRSLSDCQQSTPRLLRPSRSGSYTHVPTSPGLGSGISPSARRPSLSLNRSRSRLTIPRHVDRETLLENHVDTASPLISPVSSSFDSASMPVTSNHLSTRSPNARKSSSLNLRESPLLEEKDSYAPQGIDIDADTRRAELRVGDSGDETRGRESPERNDMLLSQSVPTTQDGLPSSNAARARSTSISSVRTLAHSYNPHLQQFPHAYHGARTIHRRDRSATISSHYLDPILASPPAQLHNRINHTTLVPHFEEDSHGVQELPDRHVPEEAAYVDQKILRNRLVRCFITLANVESEPDELKRPGQPQLRRLAAEGVAQDDDADQKLEAQNHNQKQTPTSSTEMRNIANELTPFYISPIHIKSTHPTFSGLTPRSDYANWLSVRKAAAHKVMVEVWVELEVPSDGAPVSSVESGAGSKNKVEKRLETRWRKLRHVGGIVDLRRLREVDETVCLSLLHP